MISMLLNFFPKRCSLWLYVIFRSFLILTDVLALGTRNPLTGTSVTLVWRTYCLNIWAKTTTCLCLEPATRVRMAHRTRISGLKRFWIFHFVFALFIFPLHSFRAEYCSRYVCVLFPLHLIQACLSSTVTKLWKNRTLSDTRSFSLSLYTTHFQVWVRIWLKMVTPQLQILIFPRCAWNKWSRKLAIAQDLNVRSAENSLRCSTDYPSLDLFFFYIFILFYYS